MGRLRVGRALPASLLLLLLVSRAAGQQLTPFQGRNRPPAGGADVYVSAVADQLTSVDDAEYRFEALMYMLLTWTDVRARPAVEAATLAAQNSTYNNGNGCAFPCTTIYAWTANPDAINLCCDDIWLPHFEFINVRGFSQDRVVRYGVRLGPNDSVGWWAHIQGEFHTYFQFRSFPFDRQYLNIQLQYGNKYPDSPVNIIPSATGTQLYAPATGDKLSGWTLRGVQIRTFNLSDQDLLEAGGSTFSAPGDPWPLHPADVGQPKFIGMLWQNGFEVLIEIERISMNFVITAILPVYINTCLALLVFSVSPRHLDTRLGIVVTLFLSLTALQFVLASQLPASTTVVPTQQLIMVSYFLLGFIGVSSIGVFWMVNLHRTRERQRRLRRAKRAFSYRWASVASSMGMAAAAVVKGGKGGNGGSRGGSLTQKRQPQKAAAAQAGSRAAAAPLPANNQAAAGPGGLMPAQQVAAAGPLSNVRAAGDVAAGTDGQDGSGPHHSFVAYELDPSASQHPEQQQRQQQSDSGSDPQAAGMGVFAGGGHTTSTSDDGGSSGDNSNSFASERGAGRAPPPAAAGVDEEEGGQRHPRKSRRSRQQAGCCWGPAPARGGSAGAGVAHPPKATCSGWFRLQCYKFRLMKEEMRNSQDYAVFIATSIDRHIFWCTLVLFNIAVVLIFAIQAQLQPEAIVP